MSRIAVALVHYPCLDAAGDVYATSLTNLDVHDIARSSATYGCAPFYVVHPVDAQRELADAIASYWTQGPGKTKNDDRRRAMSAVKSVVSVEDAMAAETEARGAAPRVWVTSAKDADDVVPWADARADLHQEGGLVLFGTGHGLADEVVDQAHGRIAPIYGPTDYNHLSVRAAVAIALDRLCSPQHG